MRPLPGDITDMILDQLCTVPLEVIQSLQIVSLLPEPSLQNVTQEELIEPLQDASESIVPDTSLKIDRCVPHS